MDAAMDFGEGFAGLNATITTTLLDLVANVTNVANTTMGNVPNRGFSNDEVTIINLEQEETAITLEAFDPEVVDIMCNCTHNTPPPPEFENPLKVNGGFIAMAAGLSVVIPLMCVLIIQLRRAKREEAERRLEEERMRAGSGSEGGEGSGICDPPPSYEQLFGGADNESDSNSSRRNSTASSSAVIHTRHNSLDQLIDNESETGSVASRRGSTGGIRGPTTGTGSSSVLPGSGGGSPVTVNAGSDSSVTGSGVRRTNVHHLATPLSSLARRSRAGGPHQNPTFSGSTVSVISEVDETEGEDQTQNGRGNRRLGSTGSASSEGERSFSAQETNGPELRPSTSSTIVSIEEEREDAHDTPSTAASIDSGLSTIHSSSSSSLSTSLSSSSSHINPRTSSTSSSSSSSSSSTSPSSSSTLSPPTDLPPPPRYSPPPPLPITPPPPFRSSTGGETSGQFRLHAIQRRYPNMHLSIADFIATLRGQQLQERAQENEAPPPTYEEALKILKKAEEEQQSLALQRQQQRQT